MEDPPCSDQTADAVGDDILGFFFENAQALHWTARRVTRCPQMADDAVQDALIRCIALETMEVRSLASYIYTAVRNQAHSEVRRRQRQQRPVPFRDITSDPTESWSATVASRAAIRIALSNLSSRQRDVLVMRYFWDLSEREIAQRLAISPGSVKAHASRGVANLRQLLSDVRLVDDDFEALVPVSR